MYITGAKKMIISANSGKTNFSEVINNLSEEEADIISKIRDYDEVTYKHSVNVALITHERLSADPLFSEEEVQGWTIGALLHDMGKLRTDINVLNKVGKFTDDEFFEMMAHSLKSTQIFKEHPSLTKECKIAALGHHVNLSAVQNNWEGVEKSKKPWAIFGKDLQAMFEYVLGDLSEKEKKALRVITISDMVEALRSKDRPYKEEKSWEEISKTHGDSLRYGEISDAEFDAVQDINYKKSVDILMGSSPFKIVDKYLDDIQAEKEYCD